MKVSELVEFIDSHNVDQNAEVYFASGGDLGRQEPATDLYLRSNDDRQELVLG